MSEFKVGDRVRVKDVEFEGIVDEVLRMEIPNYVGSLQGGTFYNSYRVISEDKYYTGLEENMLELIERPKTINPEILQELEQRIEKLEKCVMGEQNSLEKSENVSNLEKMTPKLGIKDFKDMIRPNKIVLNTNDPLEMIWNSTDEEEPKPSLLTEDERVILRNLDKKWKWIARDSDGQLFIFTEKPHKQHDTYWSDKISYMDLCLFNQLFNFIRFGNDEPYNIEELLKGESEE